MTPPFSAAPAGSAPVLVMENICKTIGGRRILNHVSMTVTRGELAVLIGPSGAGKSSFLQCINHLLTPDEGSVFLNGTRVNPKDRRGLSRFRQQVGMIFQDFNLFDHLTALDNVALALRRVKGASRADAVARAEAELARVGLAGRTGLYPAELSGGQKQRVAIARALAMDPIALLLDEPTSALDPELVGEVLAVIRDLAAHGMTMVMATHQMDFARALATRILFMERGEIVEQGSPEELLESGARTRTRDFCARLGDMALPGREEDPPRHATREAEDPACRMAAEAAPSASSGVPSPPAEEMEEDLAEYMPLRRKTSPPSETAIPPRRPLREPEGLACHMAAEAAAATAATGIPPEAPGLTGELAEEAAEYMPLRGNTPTGGGAC